MQIQRRSLVVALFSAILLAVIGFVHPSAIAIADDDKNKDLLISNLYLSSLTGDAHEIALTRGTDNNMQPKSSPDGEKIAFMSSRARPKAKPETSPMQLWLINAHGGEAWSLTDLAHSPKQAEWLDKDTIVFSAPEDPALYEMEMKKKKDDSDVIEDAA